MDQIKSIKSRRNIIVFNLIIVLSDSYYFVQFPSVKVNFRFNVRMIRGLLVNLISSVKYLDIITLN